MADSLKRATGRARLAAVLATVVLASCGGTTTSEPTTTTTSAPTTTSSTTSSTSIPTTTTGGDEAAISAAWDRTAVEYRGQIGLQFEVECPAGGRVGSAWGSNVYTDDSSICTAAVQAGLVTPALGGNVSIEILDGQEEYFGSDFNGVVSGDYGPWAGSFWFPAAVPLDVGATVGWDRAAVFYSGRDSTEFTVDCEANGVASSVWGTGTYTADSSICTAAVHAGLITIAHGGRVTFELVDGQDAYEGTDANGVASRSYASYGASFVFVTP